VKVLRSTSEKHNSNCHGSRRLRNSDSSVPGDCLTEHAKNTHQTKL